MIKHSLLYFMFKDKLDLVEHCFTAHLLFLFCCAVLIHGGRFNLMMYVYLKVTVTHVHISFSNNNFSQNIWCWYSGTLGDPKCMESRITKSQCILHEWLKNSRWNAYLHTFQATIPVGFTFSTQKIVMQQFSQFKWRNIKKNKGFYSSIRWWSHN